MKLDQGSRKGKLKLYSKAPTNTEILYSSCKIPHRENCAISSNNIHPQGKSIIFTALRLPNVLLLATPLHNIREQNSRVAGMHSRMHVFALQIRIVWDDREKMSYETRQFWQIG